MPIGSCEEEAETNEPSEEFVEVSVRIYRGNVICFLRK